MDAERLERAARALLAYFDQDGECKPHFYGGTIDALRAALAAPEPAPATGAVADAAIKAKAQGFDRICLRCLCGFSRTDECPRCQPTGSAQAGEAVACGWRVGSRFRFPHHKDDVYEVTRMNEDGWTIDAFKGVVGVGVGMTYDAKDDLCHAIPLILPDHHAPRGAS